MKTVIVFPQSLKDSVQKIVRKSRYSSVFVVYEKGRLSVARHLETKNVKLIARPGGEKNKSFVEVQRLILDLQNKGADRNSLVIAVGGGALLDLVGFVASIYMRGVDWVAVPTTLLAMVDSAFGGKTAVNVAGTKNVVGSFHFPKAVWVQPSSLRTLSERDWVSGFGEILKYGLLFDSTLFNTTTVKGLQNPNQLRPIVKKCLGFKARVVAFDPFDRRNRRMILNLGHTFGHALEGLDAGYRHGEAVIEGLKYATLMSVRKGLMSKKKSAPILMRLNGVRKYSSNISATRLWSRMKQDKKNTGRTVQMVLLKDFRKPVFPVSVSFHDHVAVLRQMEVFA